VPTLAGRRRPGIVIHRVKELHELDVAEFVFERSARTIAELGRAIYAAS
jgi:hypothetical protein